jgi:D-alanyl-lipoteichoic acid acyltransferase DltB (MBOAT superfamily)
VISYFVFRLISYFLDVYWGKCDPVNEFVPFAAYVAFFPQMIAGPIQRASSFVPQLQSQSAGKGRVLEGLVRMALGFAKKSLVADNLGLFVGWAYSHLHSGSAVPSLVALYLYPLQLYADFSGLADIAIGSGLVLGIEGPENFDAPFTAKSISEFWRRWHITLTAWIRDYVFLPLRMATRNLGDTGLALSLTVNMLLIGLWHGFTTGFLAYGLFQAVFLVGDVLTRSRRHEYYKNNPALARLAALAGPIFVYHVIAIGSVFFRAPSFAVITELFAGIGSGLNQAGVALSALNAPPNHYAWLALPAYALTEIADAYRRRHGIRLPSLVPRSVQWSAYACVAGLWILIALTLLASEKGANPFVYAFF